MDLGNIKRVYFLGIGGIGMSALARYFLSIGKSVAGYDKGLTSLTQKLIKEGAHIHFNDNIDLIPDEFKKPEELIHTLVIYTPAIPNEHNELSFFNDKGYNILKRSELLGLIAEKKTTIAVAGTHGKTTISTMIAHILSKTETGCNAFLGGISRNFNTNLILSPQSNLLVTEADEYDRSFLKLFPDYAVISSMDADHMDIYGNMEELKTAFGRFASQVKGYLVIKKGVDISFAASNNARLLYYSGNAETDFYAQNIRLVEGYYIFDFVIPGGIIKDIKLGQPGMYNIENAVAALAVAWLLQTKSEILAKSLESFKGIQRRFDVQLKKENLVYIDDYAHHPVEISACVKSTRELYPGRKITGIFQPHLYSRTRDLANEFAESLDLLDKLILLDIYPAREKPIKGITSKIIFDKVKINDKILCSNKDLMNVLKNESPEVLLTMGAGNIDEFIDPIKEMFA